MMLEALGTTIMALLGVALLLLALDPTTSVELLHPKE